MPLSLEPNIRFEVVLDIDKDKPIESRPTFFAKSQSMRGYRTLLAVVDRLFEENLAVTYDELFDEAVDTLATVVTGWKNMGGIEYSKEALREVLTYQEARELLRKVALNEHMSNTEKKRSESPLTSDSDSSANTAQANNVST